MAPGLACDLFFYSKVISFIGPACAFALEPVARLASYWNIPIITGMGDQVRHLTSACIRNPSAAFDFYHIYIVTTTHYILNGPID
jgi:Receptor family ligand binding region